MSKIEMLVLALFCCFFVGCNSVTASASGKNLNMAGYAMFAEGEMTNANTMTPQGKVIIGRVDYKSRKVSIPQDQKTPDTAFFKATKSKSFFGVTDTIIEYDWTASSPETAKKIEQKCQQLKEKAEQELAKDEEEKTASDTSTETKTETTKTADNVTQSTASVTADTTSVTKTDSEVAK